MTKIGEIIQSADWKSEKHVPAIDCPEKVKADEFFEIKVTLGKEIAHPNTTEHFIAWINLFFYPEGEKFAYNVGRFEFGGHGESVNGANQGPVYTNPDFSVAVKLKKSGTLYAVSHCNIHGLWESSTFVTVE